MLGKDIRIFKRFDVICRKGLTACDDIENIQKQAIRDGMKVGGWSVLIQNIFIMAMYVYVGIRAIYGMIPIREGTRYIGAIPLLQTQIGIVFWLSININTKNSYLKNYNELINVKNQKYDKTLPVKKSFDNKLELKFGSVSFDYPNSTSWN